MVTIYGNEYAVKVGSTIKPDDWRLSGKIVDGDEFSRFRLTTNNGVEDTLPVVITLTGRDIRKVPNSGGCCGIRCKITVPVDEDTVTTFGGYMYV